MMVAAYAGGFDWHRDTALGARVVVRIQRVSIVAFSAFGCGIFPGFSFHIFAVGHLVHWVHALALVRILADRILATNLTNLTDGAITIVRTLAKVVRPVMLVALPTPDHAVNRRGIFLAIWDLFTAQNLIANPDVGLSVATHQLTVTPSFTNGAKFTVLTH
jgi:hypothetical protein